MGREGAREEEKERRRREEIKKTKIRRKMICYEDIEMEE